MLFFRLLYLATVSIVLASTALVAPAQTTGSTQSQNLAADAADRDRQEAMRLNKAHKFAEAAEWWMKVVIKHPNDTEAHEALGASLLHRATVQTDQQKGLSDRLLARAELKHAQELGDTSELCQLLFKTVPPDGAIAPAYVIDSMEAVLFRIERKPVEDIDAVIDKYGVLLELGVKPANHYTATRLGTDYERQAQWSKAEKWYARAVEIEPYRSEAYRPWVDMLISLGRMKEAREKLVEGILSHAFYLDSPLKQWLAQNHLEARKIDIKVPEEYHVSETRSWIIVDPEWLGKNDGRDAWLFYPRTRLLWKNEKYMNTFHRMGYQHTLPEETDAFSQVVVAFKESLPKGNIKNPDADLLLLSQFAADGLLEPFICLVKQNRDLAYECQSYETQHRDKLMQFADKYMVPQLP
jgi:tetratricopeptide (TPR) repeat protein